MIYHIKAKQKQVMQLVKCQGKGSCKILVHAIEVTGHIARGLSPQAVSRHKQQHSVLSCVRWLCWLRVFSAHRRRQCCQVAYRHLADSHAADYEAVA